MKIAEEKQQVTRAAATGKAEVALVLTYDPKMTDRHEIGQRNGRMLAEAERRLLGVHPAETAIPVLRKLQQLVRKLNSSTHRVSVALFVSEETAKVIYLDFPVEERIVVDAALRVRDIADCKPDKREFLVLLLSSIESKMYLRKGGELTLIKTNTSQNLFAYLNEIPERTANFSDPAGRREVMLNKFLHHMDQGLGAVLKVYPLPVFVIGPERVSGHFARITRNERHVAGFLHKEGVNASPKELEQMLSPMLADWRQTLENLLLKRMEDAAQAGKLVCGLHECRKAAASRNARVIIVEEDEPGGDEHGFYTAGEIDSLVEKVLESGGVVEKMSKKLLARYGPVALIKCY